MGNKKVEYKGDKKSLGIMKLEAAVGKLHIDYICENLEVHRQVLYYLRSGKTNPVNMKLDTARKFKEFLDISYDDWFEFGEEVDVK